MPDKLELPADWGHRPIYQDVQFMTELVREMIELRNELVEMINAQRQQGP